MKTKAVQPAQSYYKPPVQLASALLERVRKNGVGAIAKVTAVSQSALRFEQQMSFRARVDNQVESRVSTQTSRSAQQNGQTITVATKQASQGETSQQRRQEIAQNSQQVVQGKVNGKPVYSNVERDVYQVTAGQRDADFNETRANNESTTRNVVRSGNATRVSLSIQSSGDRNRSDGVVAEQRTETDTRLRTYDASGNLLSDKASRQAITVRQQQDTTIQAHAEASRNLQQETAVAIHQEGNASVRQTSAETTDTSKGHQEIETHSQSTSATLVENLGAEGEVLSAKASSQQTTTAETRTIDTSRVGHNEQTTQAVATANRSETLSRTRYDLEASTVDQVAIDSSTQQFNGAGALVRQQSADRETTTTTTDSRSGEAQTRTAVTKDKTGATLSETDIKSEESVALATRTVSEQNGAKTERVIENKTRAELDGELSNRVDADGRRTISLDTKQTRQSETDDLSAGANGQGRLVETESKIAQTVQGEIDYSPEAKQTAARSGAGSVVVSIGTATGLRASFKLDQGSLEFDFSVETASVSRQEITSGKVVQTNGESTIAGTTTESERAAADSVHFHGRVLASVDADGNRVIDLEGEVTRDAAAVVVANQGQGIQAERTHSELEISGRLAVNRQVSSGNGGTQVQTHAEAALDVTRVENTESAGVNMPALTRLTSADAVRAGFQAYNGTMQLHLGGFDFGISFLA